MEELISPELLLMVSLLLTGFLLFLSVYFMITLSDLESDYINSRQCSDRLNLWTLPRLLLLLLHSLLQLPSLWLLLPSLPPALWLLHRRLKMPSGQTPAQHPPPLQSFHLQATQGCLTPRKYTTVTLSGLPSKRV